MPALRLLLVNPAVTSFAYAPPTIRLDVRSLCEWRNMLRFKILSCAVASIAAALFVRCAFPGGSHPCIAVADRSVEVTDLPWHADLHVAFTDDPVMATVRVGFSDKAEEADFSVVDDADDAEPGACEANSQTEFVTVSPSPASGAPIIYLAPEGPADFRIFVRSQRFSVRDAAALVVAADGGRAHGATIADHGAAGVKAKVAGAQSAAL